MVQLKFINPPFVPPYEGGLGIFNIIEESKISSPSEGEKISLLIRGGLNKYRKNKNRREI